MKKFAIIIGIIFITSNAFAGLKLTDEQFENLDLIHDELRKSDSNFLGLNGSKDDMKVSGISEEEAMKRIKKIDFKKKREQVLESDPLINNQKSGIKKIKAAVPDITDEELKAIGIKGVD